MDMFRLSFYIDLDICSSFLLFRPGHVQTFLLYRHGHVQNYFLYRPGHVQAFIYVGMDMFRLFLFRPGHVQNFFLYRHESDTSALSRLPEYKTLIFLVHT